MATFFKILPAVVSLIATIVAMAKEASDREDGFNEAVIAILKKASDDIRLASEVEIKTREGHANDPTDDAFDKDFQR